MSATMLWASTISLRTRLAEAADEAATALAGKISALEPDLLVAFVTPGHRARYAELRTRLRERFPRTRLLGCSGGGVIGGGREAEGITALSLTAAVLPGVAVHPVRIVPGDLPSLDESPIAWRRLVGLEADEPPRAFVLLLDPFSSPSEALLAGLDYAYPEATKIGGLASAASLPGENILYLDDETFSEGLVGVALSGNVRMDTVVAQGGQPIGKLHAVTRCQGNVLFELGNRSALEVFEEAYQSVSVSAGEEPTAFFLGIRADELDGSPGPPEFLIRDIMGVDRSSGAIAIGSVMREGQRVQFHVMTPAGAEEDLRDLLTGYCDRVGVTAGCGGFLFTCNGRGRNLFGRPDHDSDLFQEIVAQDVPLGGFFCAGEIGPIGRDTHLHGFTSSFGIVHPTR